MIRLSSLLLLLALFTPDVQSEEVQKDLFFFGNSFTKYHTMGFRVKRYFSRLFSGSGLSVRINTPSHLRGGANLWTHVSYMTWDDKKPDFTTDGWGWVVIQDQSATPVVPDYHTSSMIAARRLVQYTHDVPVMFMMTWAYRGGFNGYGLSLDYHENTQALFDGYKAYVDTTSTAEKQTYMAPCGLAFEVIYDDCVAAGMDPDDDNCLHKHLYAGDGAHPAGQGTTLCALTIGVSMTGISPYEMWSHRPYAGQHVGGKLITDLFNDAVYRVIRETFNDGRIIYPFDTLFEERDPDKVWNPLPTPTIAPTTASPASTPWPTASPTTGPPSPLPLTASPTTAPPSLRPLPTVSPSTTPTIDDDDAAFDDDDDGVFDDDMMDDMLDDDDDDDDAAFDDDMMDDMLDDDAIQLSGSNLTTPMPIFMLGTDEVLRSGFPGAFSLIYEDTFKDVDVILRKDEQVSDSLRENYNGTYKDQPLKKTNEWVILQEDIDKMADANYNPPDFLDDLITKLGGEKTMFLQPWAYKNGDGGMNFQEHSTNILESTLRLVNATNTADRPVYMAPIGLAFEELYLDCEAGLGCLFDSLYKSDGRPSSNGVYLAACVLTAALTGLDPDLIQYRVPQPFMSADVANVLQDAARRAVLYTIVEGLAEYPWDTSEWETMDFAD